MIELFGNIWDHAREYDAVVITTNGFVKKNGENVMGKGIALQAAKKYPELPRELGTLLRIDGNHVKVFEFDQWNGESDYQDVLFTFPVKPEYGPKGEPGWITQAKPDLIRRSARELKAYVNQIGYKKILMPRPGCGAGGLRWEDVKPVIEPILDDRFTVMERA